MRFRSSGFTIIELVVVMVLLGILAATALPRFVDLSSSARQAAVQGLGAAFASALNLARTKRDISATPSATTLTTSDFGTTLYFTTTADTWPVGGGKVSAYTVTPTATTCTNLFQGILNNAPINDYTITAVSNLGTSGTDTGCQFVYIANTAYYFTYDTATGIVTIVPSP